MHSDTGKDALASFKADILNINCNSIHLIKKTVAILLKNNCKVRESHFAINLIGSKNYKSLSRR